MNMLARRLGGRLCLRQSSYWLNHAFQPNVQFGSQAKLNPTEDATQHAEHLSPHASVAHTNGYTKDPIINGATSHEQLGTLEHTLTSHGLELALPPTSQDSNADLDEVSNEEADDSFVDHIAIRDAAEAREWVNELYALLKTYFASSSDTNWIASGFDANPTFEKCVCSSSNCAYNSEDIADVCNRKHGVIFSLDTEYDHKVQSKSMFGNVDTVLMSLYGTLLTPDTPDHDNEHHRKLSEFLEKPIVFDLKMYITESENNDMDENEESIRKKNEFELNFEMLEALYPLLNNPFIPKVYHNYSVDYAAVTTALEQLRAVKHPHLDENALKMQGFAGDTMQMARLLDAASRGNRLADLSRRFGTQQTKLTSFNELGMDTNEMKQDPSRFYSYSAKDPLVTVQLYLKLRERLEQTTCRDQLFQSSDLTLWDVYESYWLPFGQLLVEMEETGFKIDLNYIEDKQSEAMQTQEEKRKIFREWVSRYPNGDLISLTSKPQLAHFFFAPEGTKIKVKKKFTGTKKEFEDLAKPEHDLEWEKKPGRSHNWIEGELPTLRLPVILESKLTGKPSCNKEVIGKLINEKLNIHFKDPNEALEAINAVAALRDANSIATQINTFLGPLSQHSRGAKNDSKVESRFDDERVRPSLNLNTETGRLSSRRPNLQNQPSVHDHYAIRKAFVAKDENHTLIIADFAQIELRVMAYLSECLSMANAFRKGGDFHSRTAMSMYPTIANAVAQGTVLIDNIVANGSDFDSNAAAAPAPPLVKDVYKTERHKAKTLNFSVAYGKTAQGLSKDLGVSKGEAQDIINKWYDDRFEVKRWQFEQMMTAIKTGFTYTLLGRPRSLFLDGPAGREMFDFRVLFGGKEIHANFVEYIDAVWQRDPNNYPTDFGKLWTEFKKTNTQLFLDVLKLDTSKGVEGIQEQEKKMEEMGSGYVTRLITPGELNTFMRRAFNTPVQGTAADIVMKAMLNIWRDEELKKLGYKLLLQIHDEIVLEGPKENVDKAKEIVRKCMEEPWTPESMKPIVKFCVDIKNADTWFDGK